jgi:hypothetical protein
MILLIIILLSSLDRHTVRKFVYAGDIWTYLREFYKQTDQTVQILTLKRLITWKKNISHTIKKASQEVYYLANWIY